jgi:hypothetical protein
MVTSARSPERGVIIATSIARRIRLAPVLHELRRMPATVSTARCTASKVPMSGRCGAYRGAWRFGIGLERRLERTGEALYNGPDIAFEWRSRCTGPISLHRTQDSTQLQAIRGLEQSGGPCLFSRYPPC